MHESRTNAFCVGAVWAASSSSASEQFSPLGMRDFRAMPKIRTHHSQLRKSICQLFLATALITTVFVGSDPLRITLSPDGSRLYSANAGSNFVGVINTNTLTALPSFPVAAGN